MNLKIGLEMVNLLLALTSYPFAIRGSVCIALL